MNARVGVEAKQKAHLSAINHGGLDYAALRTGTVPGEGGLNLYRSQTGTARLSVYSSARFCAWGYRSMIGLNPSNDSFS